MINVKLGNSIAIKEDSKSLFITFDYDPQIVSQIKNIKPRVWHGGTKSWELAQSSIQELINTFGKDSLNLDKDIDLTYIRAEDYQTENTNEKWQYFNPLLKEMPNDIGKFTVEVLKQVPSYFYEVPASSTGKYHPSYALGEGGLIRHTMAAGLIAVDLFRNDTICGKFTDREKALMLSAIILHDILKSGIEKSRYTVAEHPILAAKFIRELKQDILPGTDVSIIASCISTHMGQWNTDYKTGREIMDKPNDEMQSFVHLCDYLASRKIIEINFSAV